MYKIINKFCIEKLFTYILLLVFSYIVFIEMYNKLFPKIIDNFQYQNDMDKKDNTTTLIENINRIPKNINIKFSEGINVAYFFDRLSILQITQDNIKNQVNKLKEKITAAQNLSN